MPPSPKRGFSRFIAMAMLQAARAEQLGLETASAYSWGLNRAIFFAAAKRGFRGSGSSSKGEPGAPAAAHAGQKGEYFLGDEKAYRDEESPELYFTIGGKAQTREDFERQIGGRFGGEANFRKAWNECLKIVRSYDAATLRSGHRFYEDVYKPRRDALVSEWNAAFAPPEPAKALRRRS
jgi:hypothetical protein